MSSDGLKAIRKGLLTLHTLETMAVNIYTTQITKKVSELNRQLTAAMYNEMTNVQDFHVKLIEYGWRSGKLRWTYWIVGLVLVLGLSSRLRGTKAILEADVWLETKAVHHYGELLETIDWDEDTRGVIEKDHSDEDSHVTRWKKLLQSCEAEGKA